MIDLLFSTEYIKINEINLISINSLKEIFYELGFETYLIFTFRSPKDYILSAWKQQFNNISNNFDTLKNLNFFQEEYINYFDFEKINSLKSIFEKNLHIINYDKNRNKILQNLFEIFQKEIYEEDLLFVNNKINVSFSNTEALIAEKLMMLKIDGINKYIKLLKSSNINCYAELEFENNFDTNELKNLVNNINKLFHTSDKFDNEKIIKKFNNNKHNKFPNNLRKLIALFKIKNLSEDRFNTLYQGSQNTLDFVILLILSLLKFPSKKNELIKKLVDLNFENTDFDYYIYKYYKSINNPEHITYLTKILNSGDNVNISKI